MLWTKSKLTSPSTIMLLPFHLHGMVFTRLSKINCASSVTPCPFRLTSRSAACLQHYRSTMFSVLPWHDLSCSHSQTCTALASRSLALPKSMCGRRVGLSEDGGVFELTACTQPMLDSW